MRCAIAFVPPAEDPLTLAASQWLMRDTYSGARLTTPVEGLTEIDHAFLTAAARRFGFHGTLKAPFRIDPDHTIDDVAQDLQRLVCRLEPFVIPAMQICPCDSAFVLAPVERHPQIEALAASLMVELDMFRAPLSELDMARADPGRLNRRQFANLMTWGHPFVLDQYRFHMTLTGPIDHLERDHVRLVLERHFGTLATAPLLVGQVALFIEPEPHAPFRLISVHQFSSEPIRRIA